MTHTRVPNATALDARSDAPLSQQTLLAFAGQTEQPLFGPWAQGNAGAQRRLDVTFADASRGVLVLGMTGMGKTVGVMEPALKALIDAGCSGLVLTTKPADLGMVADYPDRIEVIGGSSLATPVNLIGGMSLHTLRAFLESLRERSGVGKQPYWGSRGVVYAEFVAYTLRLMDESPSLSTLYDALSEPSWFAQVFDGWYSDHDELPIDYRKLLGTVLTDAFNILTRGGSIWGDADKQSRSDHVEEQYTWHTNMILTALAPFATDERLRSRLCDSSAPDLDMTSLLYRKRKVVLTDLPETTFGSAGRVAHEVLRLRMREAILGYEYHQEEGYGHHRYTFMVIDEFQHHVCLGGQSGSGNGLFEDKSWFDRSREYGHINIVATQGIASLMAEAPGTSSDPALASLLQNLGTTITFASHDAYTLEYLGRHVIGAGGADVQNIVSSHLAVGQALVFSHHLQRHTGSVVAHVASGSCPGLPHMAYGSSRERRPIPADRLKMPSPQLVTAVEAKSFRTADAQWTSWFDSHETEIRNAIRKIASGTGNKTVVHRDASNRSSELHPRPDEDGWLLLDFRWPRGALCLHPGEVERLCQVVRLKWRGYSEPAKRIYFLHHSEPPRIAGWRIDQGARDEDNRTERVCRVLNREGMGVALTRGDLSWLEAVSRLWGRLAEIEQPYCDDLPSCEIEPADGGNAPF